MNLNFEKTTTSLGTGVVYATQEVAKVAEIADKIGAQVINTACATIEDLKGSSTFKLGAKTAVAGLALGGLGDLTGSSTLTTVGETLVDAGVTVMGITALATAYKNRNVSVEEVQAFIKTTSDDNESAVEGV